MNKIFHKENLIKLVILLVFIALTLIVGMHHEQWADEAQAWLISRDCTYIDILLTNCKYEGHPFLWFWILRTLILSGLSYKFFFLVPIFFSAVGVGIFLYKSPFPMWIKAMFPFTYYVFYQYTIVARSYCLILPITALIAAIYPKRLEKPFIYSVLLILLANISLHCSILSGALFLLYVYDIIKNFINNRDKENIRSYLLSLSMLVLSYLFTIFYIKPPLDNSFFLGPNLYLESIFCNISSVISDSLISNGGTTEGINPGTALLIVMIMMFFKYSKNILRFLIIYMPIVLFMTISYYNKWHTGIVFLVLMFCFWIFFQKENFSFKNNKIFYVLLFFILSLQISWTAKSSIYDLKYKYSSASQTADFLKSNNAEMKITYGLGFNTIAIQPYFKKSVFKNYEHNISYHLWSKKNNSFNTDFLSPRLGDIVVFSTFSDFKYRKLESDLIQANYKKYKFTGQTFIKDGIYEQESYTIYVKQ